MKVVVNVILLLLLAACNSKTFPPERNEVDTMMASVKRIGAKDLSACIQQKIDSIKRQPVWNPPAEVREYVYKGSTVFLVSAPCCDLFTTVVDSNCNAICAPSGGITGRGDRKCPEFFSKATYVKLVWKDDRVKNASQ